MRKPEGMNFGVFISTIFMIVLVAAGWKHRNTTPLNWGDSGDHLFGRLPIVGILVVIVASYVRWANRRDFNRWCRYRTRTEYPSSAYHRRFSNLRQSLYRLALPTCPHWSRRNRNETNCDR